MVNQHQPSAAPEVFSTITSHVFFELVIGLSRYEADLSWAVRFFGVLRRMHEVRHFKLVFLLEAFWDARQKLMEALDAVIVKGLLDFLDSLPTIRIAQPRHYQWDVLDFV